MIKELTNRSLAMSSFDMCVFIMLIAITFGWIIAGVYSLASWMIGHSYHADYILDMVLSVWAFMFKCRCVLLAEDYNYSLIEDYNGSKIRQ